MNLVLEEILRTREVTDGVEVLPLHSGMEVAEGDVVKRVFSTAKPDISLEIGFAYGISALYVCDTLAENQKPAKHILIDPFQTTQWRGIGLKNIDRAGYSSMVCLVEEKSEIALPKLHSQGIRIQAAIIDGWHTFDHALVDFFYVNKMLDVGGIIIFDDANWPSLIPLMRHVSTYPAYRQFMVAQSDRPVSTRTKIRRAIGTLTRHPMFIRSWDHPTCVAFQKTRPDERNYDWCVDF
jgi:predicted O-methyltransferase YrrM